MQNRDVTIQEVFATNAATLIPDPPVPGASYRNTATTATEIADGWPYKEVVDSGKFNQAMYEYTTICKELEKYGFLPWCASTDYPQYGVCLGTNGVVYQAVQATGPSTTAQDPVNDSTNTYWRRYDLSGSIDGKSITKNSDGALQTIGVINQNSPATAIKTWSGTKAQYDAIANKDANTFYYVKDDTNNIMNTLNALIANTQAQVDQIISSIYPVGSIYITIDNTNPATTLGLGTWVKVSEGRVLQGSDSSHSAGTTVAAGIPNHTHATGRQSTQNNGNFIWNSENDDYTMGENAGSIYWNGSGDTDSHNTYTDGASVNTSLGYSYTLATSLAKTDNTDTDGVYGNSNTVQPPAYIVNIWQRTA